MTPLPSPPVFHNTLRFRCADCKGYPAGVWYVGVNGDDLAACKYTVTVSKYACPMNCTGQGECVTQSNGTRTCQCHQVGASPPSLAVLRAGTASRGLEGVLARPE